MSKRVLPLATPGDGSAGASSLLSQSGFYGRGPAGDPLLAPTSDHLRPISAIRDPPRSASVSRAARLFRNPYVQLFGMGLVLGTAMEWTMIGTGYYRLLAEGEAKKRLKEVSSESPSV